MDLVGVALSDIGLLEGSAETRILLRAVLAPQTILFFYPATGVPGRDPAIDPAPGWDDIPGAAGCTAQNRRFRDRMQDLSERGVRVIGISTQPPDEQEEFAMREHIPFRLLSDIHLSLTRALDLPTFSVGGRTFLQRMAVFVEDGVIRHVFYPIDVPEENADAVLTWLAENTSPSENGGDSSSTHAR
ncbi:MAG TPA: peroxiredoxin [Thermoanaerobaculia bacterium]|nr:peroxiredoxin [Thermoanaerobaculia bacterium]